MYRHTAHYVKAYFPLVRKASSVSLSTDRPKSARLCTIFWKREGRKASRLQGFRKASRLLGFKASRDHYLLATKELDRKPRDRV